MKLAALFVLFVIFQVTPLPKQNAAQPERLSTDAKGGKETPQRPSVGSPEPGQKEHCETENKKQLAANDSDKWARWSLYINAALALATFVLAVYAVKQANAAKASTEIAANAERSWIVTESVNRPDLQPI